MDRARTAAPIVSLLLFSLTLTACDDGSDGATGLTSGDGLVRGSVARVKTGEGVSGLVVAIVRDGDVVATTSTDASGTFALDDLPEGRYSAHLTGFELTGVSLLHTVFDPVEQGFDLAGDPVDLVFAAVGVLPPRITGEVRCDGELMPGVTLRVVGGDSDVEISTNAQGKYGATDLEEGRYAVIPLDVPCALDEAFRTARVLKGQQAVLDFGS